MQSIQEGSFNQMTSPAIGKINVEQYIKWLTESLPTAITTEEENDRLTQVLADLDVRHNALIPAEQTLADRLTQLIEAYEENHYALHASTPSSRLKTLLAEHRLRQRDIVEIFGSRGLTSEVVNGKREISKAAAKKLAAKFKVSAELFL